MVFATQRSGALPGFVAALDCLLTGTNAGDRVG